MNSEDRQLMKEAIEQARLQIRRFGDGATQHRPDPVVGCVIKTTCNRIERAFRGEHGPGEHAEFTAIRWKFNDPDDDSLSGATVYTTLEPCAQRNFPKCCCADWLIEKKIKRVVIGIPDPDHKGHGIRKLLNARIDVDVCDDDELTKQIEGMNRFFTQSRAQSNELKHHQANSSFVSEIQADGTRSPWLKINHSRAAIEWTAIENSWLSHTLDKVIARYGMKRRLRDYEQLNEDTATRSFRFLDGQRALMMLRLHVGTPDRTKIERAQNIQRAVLDRKVFQGSQFEHTLTPISADKKTRKRFWKFLLPSILSQYISLNCIPTLPMRSISTVSRKSSF